MKKPIRYLFHCKLTFFLCLLISVCPVYANRIKYQVKSPVNKKLGIFQAFPVNKDEIILVYYIESMPETIDCCPVESYDYIDREIDPKVIRDGLYRMSIWKYSIKDNKFTPLRNNKYRKHEVYRYSENRKLLAVVSRDKKNVELYEDDRKIYSGDLSKYFQFTDYSSGKSVDKQIEDSNKQPIALFVFPVYVSENKILLWVETLKGLKYNIYLINANPKINRITLTDINKYLYNLDYGAGIIKDNDNFIFWNRFCIASFLNGEVKLLYREKEELTILQDVIYTGEQFFIFKYNNKDQEYYLYVTDKSFKEQKVVIKDIFEVYHRDNYLIMFRVKWETRQYKDLIIYDIRSKTKKEFRLENKSYFPVLSIEKDKLLLFDELERKKPVVIKLTK